MPLYSLKLHILAIAGCEGDLTILMVILVMTGTIPKHRKLKSSSILKVLIPIMLKEISIYEVMNFLMSKNIRNLDLSVPLLR